MDRPVVDDVEQGDSIGNAGGVISSRYERQDLIAQPLFVGHFVTLFGDGNKQPLHDSGEIRSFPLCCGFDIFVYPAGRKLHIISKYYQSEQLNKHHGR